MPKRGRKPKTAVTKPVTVCSFSESSLEPLAASSPERVTPDMDDEEFEEWFRQRVDKFTEDSRKGFEELIKNTDPVMLDTPFSQFVTFLLEKGVKDKKQHTSNEQHNHNDSQFKLPLSVPKTRKKGDSSCNPSSSKMVHWDSALNSTASSTEKDQSESDVFKTPPKKGASVKKSTMLKTPNTSRKEQYAVVTPGPMMNKSVRVLRMPQAGETAVSLSGSPLLVTPFGANNGSQAALTLATDNGRVMTIVKPDQTSPTSDPEMFSHLEDNAKQQIKEFATYLLKNMGALTNNQTQ